MSTQFRVAVIALMLLLPRLAVAQTTPPIPLVSQWEQQMVFYGAQHCEALQSSSTPGNVKLDATYYDGERVFYQMADYTKDSKWLGCAQAAEKVYRDGYLVPNNYGAAGWMIFPHGLWKDYVRTGDTQSRDAVFALGDRAAFALSGGSLGHPDYSREVAYNLQVKLLGNDLGDSNSIQGFVDDAFAHMDAWFVSKTAPYVRPFMVALTSEALIAYYHKSGDSRVIPTLKMAWDALWNTTWLSNCLCFMYTDRQHPTGGMDPSPDLNLLIAPVFAWLYVQTGETKWLDRGDSIFSGGVAQASSWLYLAKQFNQNYRWSFDYVVWRKKIGQPFLTFEASSPTTIVPTSGGTSSPPPPPTSSGTTSPTSGASSGGTTPSDSDSGGLAPPSGHYRFKN